MENSKRSPRLRRQLRGVYLYEGACCLDITTAVWVALLAARGYSLWQIGLAEGVFHVVSLMAEIPSGMAADLLGRKRTLALSGVMAAVSGALMGFERGFGFVMASMACSALSYNLISGTLQALTYDSLCEEKRTDLYPAVQARCAWLESAGALLGRLAGGLTAVLSFTRFYLVDVGLSFLRSAAALTLREPTVTEAQAARQAADVRTLLRSLPRRLREHVRATVYFLLHSPAVARLLLANALIGVPSFLIQMFLQQRLRDAGVPTALLGLLICLFELGHPLGAWLSLRVRPPPLGLALAGGCGFAAVDMLWTLCSERRMNAEFPSDQRATLVSVDSMTYSLLMIPAAPLVGLAGDITGRAGAGLALLGGALLAVGAAAAAKLLLYKRRGVRYNKK